MPPLTRSALWLVPLLCSAPTWAAERTSAALQCADASEAGQKQRDENHYRAARESFVRCAQASCPGFIRKDCAAWLGELDAAMPSVIVAATDEHGADVLEAELAVDGEIVRTRLDGTPLSIDPGAHELRVTASGRMPMSLPVVIRVGERNRLIPMQLAAPLKPAPPEATATPAPAASVASPTAHHDLRPPPVSIVLGGLGLVGVGLFAGLQITASNDYSALERGCAPYCSTDDRDSVRTRMVVGDVALAGGVIALGAGALTWILHAGRAPAHRQAFRPAWSVTSHGASASVGGHF